MEMTSLDHGIYLSFGQQYNTLEPKFVFFAPFHVILMPNFDILSYGYSYFTPGKGYLSLILCPLSRGSEKFFFVRKNNSPGVSPRANHGKGNDKCINPTYRFTMSKLISCTSHTWRLNNHIIYNSYKPLE